MKKSLVALAILLMFLLCGCQASEKADDLDYGDAFSKVQTIAVISPDTLEVIETITDAEDIQNFTQALDVGQWELASLPDHASKLGTFGLSQQKTIQLLDTTPDETLYDVGSITLYEGGYIGIEIDGLDWLTATFEVSDNTADYLNGYFE